MAYMRRMVMELPLVVQYGVVGMVQLQQMLQSPSRLLLCCIDLMNPDWRDINKCSIAPWQEAL